nr:hypothetical protein [Tanacetum cinerariifolium]
MAISVDRIHQQYQKENVVDFDFDVVEESKEFQKLSLTDVPQVPKSMVVLIPDKTPDDYSAIPYTYSPRNPEWLKVLEEKYKDFACTTCLSRPE